MKLTMKEIDMLALYNSEVARGIVHTDEWKAVMAALQKRFNEEQRFKLIGLRW